MSDSLENNEGRSRKHANHHGGGSHEEAHEGAPEWLISFADMVMLMMGFFVILFALNATPAGRNPGGMTEDVEDRDTGKAKDMLDFAISVRQAFNNPVDMNSTRPEDQPLIERLKQRGGSSETRDPGIKGHEQDVQSIRPNDYFAISGHVPFGENSSEILQTGMATIAEVARKMRGLRLIVEVRGHVSPIEAAQGAEHAIRLSSDRAQAVAGALAEQGVDWWQMRLVLCADHDPVQLGSSKRVADNSNARVEVIMTNEVIADRVPTRYE